MKNYLIYTTVTVWNEPPRARHQVANELKADGTIYFVERNSVGFPRIEVKKVEDNVFVITPYYWLPYKVRYRLPFINEMYHTWLLKKLKKLKAQFDIVVTFDYTAPAIHKHYNNVLFYCADDNVGFGNFNPGWVNRYHTNTEKKVAAGSQLCVVTSDYMGKKIGAYNPKTHVIPLGAPSIAQRGIAPPDKKGDLPVLGLVGFLDYNLDHQLLDKILSQFKTIIIGPASPETLQKMVKYPRAELVGIKTGNALYETMERVDVCIAPYDIKKLNKGATPNKLWLYLALGKPAVVTNMPNIESWVFEEKLVYKCTNDCFIDKCLEAYKDDSLELRLKRVEVAKSSSWSNRVAKMKELFFQS